jgi:bacillithiol biosynthesis deacetylase BshB1
MNLDVLAIGAHPDDVELAMSGSVLVFAGQGRKVGVVDLTRGELGTRGSQDRRASEAAEATRMLGLVMRENLDLPDGSVQDGPAERLALVGMLRRCRPRLVFTHHPEDHTGHPDHRACSQLVQHAVYLSGLSKIKTDAERYRPEAVVCFNLPRRLFPTFVVDTSAVYSRRCEILGAYRSQFHDPESKEPATYLSAPGFQGMMESAHRYWGGLIGAEYGEAFWCRQPPALADPTAHFTRAI